MGGRPVLLLPDLQRLPGLGNLVVDDRVRLTARSRPVVDHRDTGQLAPRKGGSGSAFLLWCSHCLSPVRPLPRIPASRLRVDSTFLRHEQCRPLYFMQAPFFISYVLLNGFAKYPIYLCRASSLVIYSFKASTAGSENTHDLRRVSNDSCSVPFVPSPGSWRGVVGIVQNAAAAPSAPRPACEPMRLHDVRPEHAAHAGPDVDLRGLCPTKEMRCR